MAPSFSTVRAHPTPCDLAPRAPEQLREGFRGLLCTAAVEANAPGSGTVASRGAISFFRNAHARGAVQARCMVVSN